MSNPPDVRSFTAAPLRNRVRLELNASVSEVWALLGDLKRFPEYSAGLDRVEATEGANGRPSAYVCHFKPMEEGADAIVSRETIRWWAAEQGYASSSAGADAFGLKNDLHLVRLEAAGNKTMVAWEEYYDAEDVAMMRAHFDEALMDAGENLVRRFGGRVSERYVET